MLIPLWLVWVAYGLAVASVILLAWHLARVLPSAPSRIPLHLGIDGRPGSYGPKGVLWLAPAIVVPVLAALGLTLTASPPGEYDRAPVLLAMVIVIEIASLLAWAADRLIEVGRKMTHRIAPTRILVTMLPLLATVALNLLISVVR